VAAAAGQGAPASQMQQPPSPRAAADGREKADLPAREGQVNSSDIHAGGKGKGKEKTAEGDGKGQGEGGRRRCEIQEEGGEEEESSEFTKKYQRGSRQCDKCGKLHHYRSQCTATAAGGPELDHLSAGRRREESIVGLKQERAVGGLARKRDLPLKGRTTRVRDVLCASASPLRDSDHHAAPVRGVVRTAAIKADGRATTMIMCNETTVRKRIVLMNGLQKMARPTCSTKFRTADGTL
jgi:hypothetical protein